MEKTMNLIVLKHTQLDAYFTTQHVEHAKWIIEHTSMEYDDPPKKWDAYSYLVVFYFKEPLGVSYFQFKSIEDVNTLCSLMGIKAKMPIDLRDSMIYDIGQIDGIRIALFYSTK
jgi:hypothetical protein